MIEAILSYDYERHKSLNDNHIIEGLMQKLVSEFDNGKIVIKDNFILSLVICEYK